MFTIEKSKLVQTTGQFIVTCKLLYRLHQLRLVSNQFSCLTKERIPYSSEAEWRLFSDFSELEEGENGKKFDFLVKPCAIVMGRNIERNLDFRDRVREYSSKSGIRLLKAQDIKK